MDTPAGNRQYRNPLADTQDQFLFFGLFLIGATGIWAMKLYGFSQITVTVFPLCLMLLYVAIAFLTKRYRLREDRVGDNIYYLGFLYTLVSLAYALFAYNSAGAGAEEIITNFGIAIGTTIFGLAGRVFFNQMREDPVEYEREARYSLAEASSALRSQLADISIDLSSFKRKIVQITEEGIVDVSNTAKASMSENAQRLSSTSDEVINTIQGAFRAFTDHSKRLNDIASKNVEALQSLFERIEKIEASPGLLAAKFDPIIQKFDEVATEATKRNRAQTSDVKRLRDMIEAAMLASEALKTSVAETDNTVTQKINKFSNCFDAISAAAGHLTEALNNSVNALSNEVAAAKAATAELNQDTTLHQQSISQLRSAIAADLQIIRQHGEAMSNLVAESRESVKVLQNALVSMSRTLAEQLSER